MFSLLPFQKSPGITFASFLSCGPAVGAALVGWQGNKSVFKHFVLECWAMGGGKDGWLFPCLIMCLITSRCQALFSSTPLIQLSTHPRARTSTSLPKNGARSQSLLQCDSRRWTLQRKSEHKGKMRDQWWNKSIEKESRERLLWTFLKSEKSSSVAHSYSSSIVKMPLSSFFQFSFSFSFYSSHLTSLWSTGAWSAEEYSGREMSAKLRSVWKCALVCVHVF